MPRQCAAAAGRRGSVARVKWLLVFLGGGIGSVLRYALAGAVQARTDGFPFGTLAVNAAGCLAIGLLWGVAEARGVPAGAHARVLIFAGLLGGFTTFSSFGLETLLLVETGRWPEALAYAGASLVGGVTLVAAGLVTARALA